MARTYQVNFRGTLTVSEQWLKVDADMANLKFEIENDYLAEHTPDERAEDMQHIDDVLMASPMNHRVTEVLHG